MFLFVIRLSVSFSSFFPSSFLSLFLFLFPCYISFYVGNEMVWSECHSISPQCNSRHKLPVLNRDVIHSDLSTSLLCSFSFLPPPTSVSTFLSKLQFSKEWAPGWKLKKAVSWNHSGYCLIVQCFLLYFFVLFPYL